MKIVRAAVAILTSFLAACGGGGGDNDKPDAFVSHDAARACQSLTSSQVDFTNEGQDYLIWGGPLSTTLSDGLELDYQFEFYDGIEPSLAGTFDLHAGNQANYKTCAICIRAFAFDATGQVVKRYFQSAGSVTLTEDPFTNRHMIASITGLQLEEVTIAQDYTSTPVANSTCAEFADFTIDHDRVPNAWTCTHDKWDSGASCDCVCGLPDPDCVTNAPVAGCTTQAPACFNDACVTPPTNDTCATATALTIGTPVTGTTAGAGRNYNSGLEAPTCTGFSQPGPDVVYSVSLAQDQAITVTLSNLAATYDGAVALLGPGAPAICDASPIATCVEGADGAGDGQNETFTYTATAAGTYYIVVDAWAPFEGGTFTLDVTSP